MSEMQKILVIDDEQVILDVVRDTLSEKGYEVLTAATTEAAQEILDTVDVGLILLDQFIDENNGLDFLADMRARQKRDIPVIIITGYPHRESVETALKYGIKDYMTKPIDFVRLCAVVRAIMPRKTPPGDVPEGAFANLVTLVIADSKETVKPLVEALHELNAHVTEVTNWFDGMRMMGREKPQVVFISSNLSEVDGTTMINRLQKGAEGKKRAFVLIEDSPKADHRRKGEIFLGHKIRIDGLTVESLASLLKDIEIKED